LKGLCEGGDFVALSVPALKKGGKGKLYRREKKKEKKEEKTHVTKPTSKRRKVRAEGEKKRGLW